MRKGQNFSFFPTSPSPLQKPDLRLYMDGKFTQSFHILWGHMHPGHPLVPFLVSMASETIKQKEELNSHFGDKITAHTYLLDTEKITVILCITAIQHGRTMELRCQTKLKCVTRRPCFSHVIVEFNLILNMIIIAEAQCLHWGSAIYHHTCQGSCCSAVSCLVPAHPSAEVL